MPPGRYLALHPEARLSDAEIARLIDGLPEIYPVSAGTFKRLNVRTLER